MTNLYDLDFPALEARLMGWGGTHGHAREVWAWLYRQWPVDFEHLPDLPGALRERLVAETTLGVPTVLTRQEAPDGKTRKDLLQLADGERVEVVLLRYRERRSACISTQVGCACGCRFCATGQSGFTRQLSAGEISAQVLHFQRELAIQGQRLSNFVLMGMGEPLLNYDHTLAALHRLSDPRGLGFAPRRITLSTVGIAPGIERLSTERLPLNLAISLHAATDDLRSQLLPINRRYPLDVLFASVEQYTQRTGRRIMFEWVMIDGINDTREQANALAARLAGLPVHVNLIRLNPIPEYTAQPSTPEAIATFVTILDRAHIPHTLRQSRGGAIAAGCGQLRRAVVVSPGGENAGKITTVEEDLAALVVEE